ncbi:MAG: DNA mismatch repair protein MutS [Ardenticatenia bacterium]|nr:DNA mismatch repair protein MutS [Ardenticatenia bacterium]
MSKVTPVRRQYLELKSRYPDAILFFRLGDFYETFDDDAETVARELDIVLTSRNVGKDQRVPMAGVPYHAAETYIARLIEKGYKVAIAEQIGDPRATKGLMRREVVRVVTAGTVVEPDLLSEKQNNYLVALVRDERRHRAGLAYVDITTGEFACTEIEGQEVHRHVHEELERLRPAEVIMPGEAEHLARPQPANVDERGFRITTFDAWHWELETAQRTLCHHFGVQTLDGFGCRDKPLAMRAAGAILAYLQETQRAALSGLRALYTYSTAGFMALDAATRRNLELTESMGQGERRPTLLSILDLTHTPMGGRFLRRSLNQPLLSLEAIERRLDAVDALYRDMEGRMEVRALLKQIADLERLTNRAITGLITPRELGHVRDTLRLLPDLLRVVAEVATRQAALLGSPPRVAWLDPARYDECADLLALLDAALADELPARRDKPGFIRPTFSDELHQIIEKSRHAREWIAGLEQVERERTGIKSLKVGYNKVFGYYIEVTKANAHLVPEHYIRKQTLVNAERYITPELKEYEALVLHAEERQLELENRLYQQVLAQVAAASERLLRVARLIARLDTSAALAEVAARHRYVRPELHEGDEIHIVAGRHPVVEQALQDKPFIPNDTYLSAEEAIHIITGPNMSGKSTYLRQVALIVLLAQIGAFVPADEAKIGLVDRIFTRVGAHDERSPAAIRPSWWRWWRQPTSSITPPNAP